MTSLLLLISYDFEPTDRDRWLAHFSEIAPTVRAEPGCIAVFAGPDPDSNSRVHLVEHYRDEHAFQDHLSTPYLAAFRQTIKTEGLNPKVSAIRRYDATERGQ